MRILQLVTRRQCRGAEVFAAQLSECLVARGHDVHYAGINPPLREPIIPQGVTAEDVSKLPPSVLSIRTIRDLVAYLRQVHPDVVQANGGYAMKYVVLAQRLGGGKCPIVYCNIGLSSDWLRRPGQRLWNRWILKHAKVTAAVSEASRNDLIETYGLDQKTVVVVRRGVDTTEINRHGARVATLGELNLSDEVRLLLHVGSFTPEKNHEGLLRIFDKIVRHCPQAHLVCVGIGPLHDTLDKSAVNRSQIHFLGTRQDVPHLMAAADLFLLPSLTEGIPGVVLEAGTQSLPSVAYDVGGVAEAIQHDETGCLATLNDEKSFTDAVIRLLGDEAIRDTFGRQARRLVIEQYSMERSVDEFESLYELLVPRGDRNPDLYQALHEHTVEPVMGGA